MTQYDPTWADEIAEWADAIAAWGNSPVILPTYDPLWADGTATWADPFAEWGSSPVSTSSSEVYLPTLVAAATGDYTPGLIDGSAVITLPELLVSATSSFGAQNRTGTAVVNLSAIRVAATGGNIYFAPPTVDAPPTYRIEARDPDGNFYAQLDYRDLQFEVMLNKPSGFRFKVPLREGLTKQVLEAGKHEAWIYRDDVLVKAGPIWNCTPNSNDNDINCDGSDLLDYFDVLRIDAYVRYAAMDQFDIVADLIATAQAQTDGDYGIISSLGQSGIVINREYKDTEGKYVLEAIQDIAAEDTGFDFWVSPTTRRFEAAYPRLSRNIGLRLEYPNAIRTYSVNYFGKWHRNDVLVLGPYNRVSRAISTDARAYYKLRQLTESYTDAPDPTALAARASYIRDLRTAPKVSPIISLESSYLNVFDPATIRMGDMITTVIDDGYVQVNELLRLIGFQVTVGRQGQESVVLYFNDNREVV